MTIVLGSWLAIPIRSPMARVHLPTEGFVRRWHMLPDETTRSLVEPITLVCKLGTVASRFLGLRAIHAELAPTVRMIASASIGVGLTLFISNQFGIGRSLVTTAWPKFNALPIVDSYSAQCLRGNLRGKSKPMKSIHGRTIELFAWLSSHLSISSSNMSNGKAPSFKSLSWNRRTSNRPPKTLSAWSRISEIFNWPIL